MTLSLNVSFRTNYTGRVLSQAWAVDLTRFVGRKSVPHLCNDTREGPLTPHGACSPNPKEKVRHYHSRSAPTPSPRYVVCCTWALCSTVRHRLAFGASDSPAGCEEGRATGAAATVIAPTPIIGVVVTAAEAGH